MVAYNSKDADVGCRIQYRYVLVGLLCCATAIDFLTRYSISISIISLLKTEIVHMNFAHLSLIPSSSLNLLYSEKAGNQHSTEGEYDWSYEYQGLILGTFFWGYFISKTISGRLAEIFGPREVVSLSLLICGIMSLLCPWSAQVHPLMLAGCRLLIGMAQGPIFPVINIMLVRWIPHESITTMFALVSQGVAFGSLFATLGSGWIISVLGWRWVFYGGGILTLALLPAWIILTRNDPEEHPYITQQEKELLRTNNHIVRSKNVPWGSIFRCYYVYLSMFIEFIMCWCDTVTQVDGPTYLTDQIGLTLLQSSMVLGIAQIIRLFIGFLPGVATDYMIQKNILSKLYARRLMHAIVQLLESLIYLLALLCDVMDLTKTEGMTVNDFINDFDIAQYEMVGNESSVSDYTLALVSQRGNHTSLVAALASTMENTTSQKKTFLKTYSLHTYKEILYQVYGMCDAAREWNDKEVLEVQYDGTKKTRLIAKFNFLSFQDN
ncbi:unnamed protein product, partial [Meganyctiphanes norvegica]